jgi:hypothetical protein
MFRNELYERHAVILSVFVFVLVVCFWSILNTLDHMELFRNQRLEKRITFLTQYADKRRNIIDTGGNQTLY